MRSFWPSRRVWAIAEAFTTLLAIGLIAPAQAQADCKHPSDRPAFGLSLGAGHLGGSPEATEQAPPPKPCSGPSCSNKSAPTPTSAPTPPPRVELWGLAAETPPLGPLDSSAWALEEARERPIRLAIPFFHPPRPSR